MIGCATACSSEQVERPNVLLILTDDQGWGDFGFNGNEIINTPVLDSVTLEGGKAILLTPYTPIKIESPDRSPRVEAYEQIWAEQEIGTLHLQKGESQIKLCFDKNEKIELGSLEIKGIKIVKL